MRGTKIGAIMTIMCKIFAFRLNYILKGNPLSEEKRKEADDMEDNDLLHLLKSEPETGVAQFLEQYASMVYSIVVFGHIDENT